MTILPKKKSSGPKSDSENGPDHGQTSHYQMSIGQLPSQSSEAHERLFVSGGVADDLRWAGSPRPGQSSPPRWAPLALPSSSHHVPTSREEKRHSPHSPLHPSDYEDSLDGAPSSKRVRQHRPHPPVRVRPAPALPSCSRVPSPVPDEREGEDLVEEGYNSEDEYSHVGQTLSEEEWVEKDLRFERIMGRKGYNIKRMGEDGACLFRAVADQLYGDQEMHHCVRAQCMDYIERNADYYSQYVTEDFEEYVSRKRTPQVHGNHLEIQALSEMYSRPIHIYCYSSEPINIFQHINRTDSELTIPIRLCYHRGVHYNSLIDPNNASLGVGLGLPGLKPGMADKNMVREALVQSENTLTEQKMIEDKIKATDWEATNEAIEEQVARDSYLQWLADQEKVRGKSRHPPAATVTSGQVSPRGASGTSSPRGGSSPRPRAGQSSPKGSGSPRAGCSSQPDGRDSPKPGSSRAHTVPHHPQPDHGLGPGFHLRETASYLNGLPPDLFEDIKMAIPGLDEWGEDAVLSQVLAASQQEYLDSLKKREGETGEKKVEEESSDM
eukprot:GFUD01024011.1.p1 GENE.GFUD01024011.1~~GFUD01024011.1.p1  ORF type:complete len:552 (-),score=140.82 GFUD01024011.1:329-1984(-)